MARAGLLRIPTAVVTDAVLARGVMTAVSWLGAPIKGFAPGDLFRAFEFLKISPPVRARIPALINTMRAELRGTSILPPDSGVHAARHSGLSPR